MVIAINYCFHKRLENYTCSLRCIYFLILLREAMSLDFFFRAQQLVHDDFFIPGERPDDQ